MTDFNHDVEAVLRHIAATIGDPSNWHKWPGGWPGDIETALVDSIYSARAVYYGSAGRGIYSRVVAWRDSRTRTTYSLAALRAEIDAAGIDNWAHSFGNRQLSPQRLKSSEGGPSKAAAIRESSHALLAHEIDVAADITSANSKAVWRVLQGVSGVGYATANYFLMLLGAPGVKPDRMIHRFLTNATGHTFTNADAERALLAASAQLEVKPHDLDHAIWSYESKRAR